MRFEWLEHRRLLDSSPLTDGFYYSSDTVDVSARDAINAGDLQFSESNAWYRLSRHQPPVVSQEGYLIASRTRTDTDLHTLFVAQVRGSDCYGHSGLYTLPQTHYWMSFDVRHPETEIDWLSNHQWNAVMQLWGPGEDGLNPPFSVQTVSQNGQPMWIVRGYGDADPTTVRGEYDYSFSKLLPYEGIGEWHSWDVEIVPDSTGNGLVRVWLNGELVGAWSDIQIGYNRKVSGQDSGPLNPGFGMYGGMAKDGMQVHLDHLSVQCGGAYENSLSGFVEGAPGDIVRAVNRDSNVNYEVKLSQGGVYSFNLPAGTYDVETIGADGTRRVVGQVDLSNGTQVLNLGQPKASNTNPPVVITKPPIDPAAADTVILDLFADPEVVTEGNVPGTKYAQLTVQLRDGEVFDHDINSYFSTKDGTAVTGEDFSRLKELLVRIPAYTNKVTFFVPITSDQTVEDLEQFTVSLIAAAPTDGYKPGGAKLGIKSAVVTIRDDDSQQNNSTNGDETGSGGDPAGEPVEPHGSRRALGRRLRVLPRFA